MRERTETSLTMAVLIALALLAPALSMARTPSTDTHPCLPKLVESVATTYRTTPRLGEATYEDSGLPLTGPVGAAQWVLRVKSTRSNRLIGQAECVTNAAGHVVSFVFKPM